MADSPLWFKIYVSSLSELQETLYESKMSEPRSEFSSLPVIHIPAPFECELVAFDLSFPILNQNLF